MVTPSVVNVGGEVPIVAIDPHTGPADLPTVESDSFRGAQLATRYLIELGHTRIGFIAGRPDLRSSIAARRRLSQRAAGGRHRVRCRPGGSRALPAGRVARSSRTSCSSQVDRPTAIFAANDISAIAMLTVAARARDRRARGALGHRVRRHPRGVPPRPGPQHGPPAHAALGAEAATAAARAHGRRDVPEQTHVSLPTRLVPRAHHRAAALRAAARGSVQRDSSASAGRDRAGAPRTPPRRRRSAGGPRPEPRCGCRGPRRWRAWSGRPRPGTARPDRGRRASRGSRRARRPTGSAR